MKMKKIKMMTLTLTFAAVLTACGSQPAADTGAASGTDSAVQNDNGKEKKDGEKVTITVWGEEEQQSL